MLLKKVLTRYLLLLATTLTLIACGGGSGGGGSSSGSWSIGGQSYSARTVEGAETFENLDTPSFAILTVNNGTPFRSNISISYTLTGEGRYFVTSFGNVSNDDDLAFTNRIGILAQEIDPSAANGVSLYTSADNSGFVDVTVDASGNYHFDIPSNSPITLFESTGSNNTVDFSLNDIHDFR